MEQTDLISVSLRGCMRIHLEVRFCLFRAIIPAQASLIWTHSASLSAEKSWQKTERCHMIVANHF